MRDRKLSAGVRALLWAGLILIAGAGLAAGQIPTVTDVTSTPTPGAGHDYIHGLSETVMPGNGSLSVRITAQIPRGRGPSLPFSLAYDSGILYPTNTGSVGNVGWLNTDNYLMKAGWTYSVPMLSLSLRSDRWMDTQSGMTNPTTYVCDYTTDYVFQAPGAQRWPLGLSNVGPASGYSQNSCQETTPKRWTSTSAVIGPIIATTVAATNGSILNQPVTVTDADGNTYNFTIPGMDAGQNGYIASFPSTIQDRNGNYISSSDYGGGHFVFTDSLGRALISSSGFGDGGSGDTVTVAGLSSPYAVQWGPVSASYSVSSQGIDGQGNDTSSNGCTFNDPVSLPQDELAVKSITLPNQQSYTFEYDPTYGRISKITYPSGASVTYTWASSPQQFEQGAFVNNIGGTCVFRYSVPVVATRTVNDGSRNVLEQIFTYSDPTWVVDPNLGPMWTSRTTTMVEKDLTTTPNTVRTIVYTYTNGGGSAIPPNDSALPADGSPVEQSITYENGSGTALQTTLKTWDNPRELASRTVEIDPGLSTQRNQLTTWQYDSNEQVTQKDESDYYGGSGSVVPSNAMIRQTLTTYANFAANPSDIFSLPHIVDRPQSVEIDAMPGGSAVREAYTWYCYDHFSLPASNAIDHVDPGTNQRGNLTGRLQWVNPPGGSNALPTANDCGLQTATANILPTTWTYDDAGQLLSVKDAAGNTTSYTWGDATGSTVSNTDAFLNQVNYPDTNSPNLAHHVESYTWDYLTGHMLSHTGQNVGEITQFGYVDPNSGAPDPLGRLRTITYPPGGGETKITYGDVPGDLYTEVQREIDASGDWTDEYTLFDGLGQPVGHSTLDPDNGWDRTDTSYNGLGQVAFRSYPCAATSPTGAAVCTAGDTFTFDALGRPLTVTHSDGSQISTSYAGAATEIEDEGTVDKNGSPLRVTRILQHDGLGRLTSVCEVDPNDPNAGKVSNSSPGDCNQQLQIGGTSSNPVYLTQDLDATGFLTAYSYDSLGNLTTVQQPGLLPRVFTYDSLSRLVSSDNPESNTDPASGNPAPTQYQYDSDSNCPAPNSFPGELVSRTGARGIRTCFAYDALNRLLSKTYSDGVTPAVTFGYDQSQAYGAVLSNPVGRMTSAAVLAPATQVSEFMYSYDPMGRVAWNDQCTYPLCGTGTHAVHSVYDLLGDITQLDNGLSVSFQYSYNQAGRATQVVSSWVDSLHPQVLASQAVYNARGERTGLQLGNGVAESWQYDARGRLLAASAGALYQLQQSWQPDGDLATATDSVNGDWQYRFDAFNRLAEARCSLCPAGVAPVYDYVYDRYGNRWQVNDANGLELEAGATFNGGDNRMDGRSYDAAGDLLGDGSQHYGYDGAGRLATVDGGATASYVYNAEGARVLRQLPDGWHASVLDGQGRELGQQDASEVEREEIDLAGQRLATYYWGSTWWAHTDGEGTARAYSDPAGALVESCSNLPFGEAQSCTASGSAPGDLSPLHFTGKPRDPETGLDNFGARYNSSTLGRFMTPDWAAQASPVPYAKLDNPQSLNLYSYVLNNPVTGADPNGHDWPAAKRDLKRAFSQISVSASIGLGFGGQAEIGTAEGEAEAAAKANLSFSKGVLSLSKSVDIGLKASAAGVKAALGVSAKQVVVSVNVSTGEIAGTQPATGGAEAKIGYKGGGAGASAEGYSLGSQSGDIVLGGGKISISKEGLADLEQAVSDWRKPASAQIQQARAPLNCNGPALGGESDCAK